MTDKEIMMMDFKTMGPEEFQVKYPHINILPSQQEVHVGFKRLHPNAIIPSYAHPGEDAGLDMTCTEIVYNEDYIAYKVGLAVEIPWGYYGDLRPRSSNCKKDLLLCNSCGTVDAGYRGEIEFRYKAVKNYSTNHSNNTGDSGDNFNTYQIGDKVGQLIIKPYPLIVPYETEELGESTRGTGGYGSTGK